MIAPTTSSGIVGSRVHVLALPRYGRLGASSRLRWLQFEPSLRSQGIEVRTAALLDDDYLQRKYAGRTTWAAVLRAYGRRVVDLFTASRRKADVVWLEKELWPWAPAWLELCFLRRWRYVIDFDDAIFHTYDQHRRPLLRRLYRHKIDRLMRHATLVVAGSPYLAQRARAAGAAWVEDLPTVVDHRRYAPAVPAAPGRPVRIGWIGSPATVKYVQRLAAPLAALAAQRPVELHLVGAEATLTGVTVVSVPWTEASEAANIAGFDVGVMPLPDTSWERGKCGYKLVQYMASGLPVVASPVGANQTIVADGVDGFLADDDADWLRALTRLADDRPLRERMGQAGRAKVAAQYSLAVAAPRLAAWLHQAGRSTG